LNSIHPGTRPRGSDYPQNAKCGPSKPSLPLAGPTTPLREKPKHSPRTLGTSRPGGWAGPR